MEVDAVDVIDVGASVSVDSPGVDVGADSFVAALVGVGNPGVGSSLGLSVGIGASVGDAQASLLSAIITKDKLVLHFLLNV